MTLAVVRDGNTAMPAFPGRRLSLGSRPRGSRAWEEESGVGSCIPGVHPCPSRARERQAFPTCTLHIARGPRGVTAGADADRNARHQLVKTATLFVPVVILVCAYKKAKHSETPSVSSHVELPAGPCTHSLSFIGCNV